MSNMFTGATIIVRSSDKKRIVNLVPIDSLDDMTVARAVKMVFDVYGETVFIDTSQIDLAKQAVAA